jgi:tetratricopeptide (TPR) repeat protein
MRTCYAFITLLLISLLFLGCGGQSQPGESPDRKTIDTTLESAENVVRTSRTKADLERIFFELKGIRNPYSRDFATESTYAKVCFYYGDRLENGDEKDSVWESGLEAGKIASRLEPDRPDGFYWAAANLNALSKKNPLTVGIKSTQELRDLAGEATRLDAGFEHGGALRILAQVELFTGLVGGSPQKAVEYLEQAVRYDTRDGSVRLSLAEAYLLSRRYDDARRVLREIIEMKPEPNFSMEHEVAVQKARRMLERNL